MIRLPCLRSIADGKLFFRDEGAVTALELLNGEDVFVAEGKMFQSGADVSGN